MLVFVIEGAKVEIVRDRAGLLVDRACSKNSACEARKAGEMASNRLVRDRLMGGSNPGAEVCLMVAGRVVIGTDQARNQNSFCRFGDGSLVSNGSLAARAFRDQR